VPPATGRYGFHWFPDDEHFQLDLFERFVPHLAAMGAGWLVLRASLQPVPEAAAIGALLREAGIEPLLHLVPEPSATPEQLRQAVEGWAEGGVRVVAFDDQPNLAARWNHWEPRGLPQRYARWLAPYLAALAEVEGVVPLFPPLAPGGDYWDTTFLEEALAELRVMNPPWLSRMGVACVNNLAGRPATWGKGGPTRWGASLRSRRRGQEDQIGFRAWEWAGQIARQQLGRSVEVYALATRLSPDTAGKETTHRAEVQAVREALATEPSPALGATFWLLADERHSPTHSEAWFSADGTPLRHGCIAALRQAAKTRVAHIITATLPATVRVKMEDGEVREFPVEKYLRGLLANEMSPIAPLEALMAQAIALRCFVARSARAPRHASEGADLCTTDHCKLWHPYHYENTDQAIRQTANVVATYDGQLISASTFQRCNGRTRDAEEVWHTALPYCRPVPCVASGGSQHGHGVGMCRQGAIRMAQQGASFDDILHHYFTGITVTEMDTATPPTAQRRSAKCGPSADAWKRRVPANTLNHAQWFDDAIELALRDAPVPIP
jgi:hypothetical protein